KPCMHSASGPSPCVWYSNVSWLARTVPLLKSCMALPPTVYASLLAPKRAPVLMDVDKVVTGYGLGFWPRHPPSPARHHPGRQARHSAPVQHRGHPPAAEPTSLAPSRCGLSPIGNAWPVSAIRPAWRMSCADRVARLWPGVRRGPPKAEPDADAGLAAPQAPP